MLAYLFPVVLIKLLWQQRAFYPLCRDAHAFCKPLCWSCSAFFYANGLAYITGCGSLCFGSLSFIKSSRATGPGVVSRCVLLPVGAVAFAFWASLWFTVFVLAWSLRALALPMVLALYTVSLVLVVSLFILTSVLAAVSVVARGLAFVVAGVASVIYSYHPEIGVCLIVLGLLIEYGFRYRDEKRHRFQLGHIIERQQSSTMAEVSRAD